MSHETIRFWWNRFGPIFTAEIRKKRTGRMRGFSGLAVAYDLIGYFLRLDTIEEFSKNEQKQLKDLLNKHRYDFFRKVISIRTQRYLNTHQVRTPVEQAVCSSLKIRYKPRPKKL